MKEDIVSLILNKVGEESAQEAEKIHTLGLYRASAVGGCPRALQYATLQYPAEVPSPEVFMIFRDGHLHHGDVRALLGKVGTLSHVEQSISKRYLHNKQKFVITGTVDGVFNGEVFDVKSMNTFRFKILDRTFPEEYFNYVAQLTIYMDILKLKKGFFIFKDKNSAELKIKKMIFKESILNQILDVISEVHKGCLSEELMDKPYERNSFQCKTCPYRMPCWRLPMEQKHWQREGPKDAQGMTIRGQLRESLKALGKAE